MDGYCINEVSSCFVSRSLPWSCWNRSCSSAGKLLAGTVVLVLGGSGAKFHYGGGDEVDGKSIGKYELSKAWKNKTINQRKMAAENYIKDKRKTLI